MEEIVKHINDTNASYRQPNAGDAKNTDLFLDNEHYSMFKDCGEQITVRYNKENLTKAILFIASILPRKFDQSATHKLVKFSKEFVLDQLAIIDALFTDNGEPVDTFTQVWNARKDVPQKNGLIDKRFYFNGLLKDIIFTDYKGNQRRTKFTIRNYFAGGYTDLHIVKANDGIFDIRISNANVPTYDKKEEGLEDIESNRENQSLQQIYYGAPGTGKSHTINKITKDWDVIRTTFHPDSDYSTFVGAYKPTVGMLPICDEAGQPIKINDVGLKKEQITYKFVRQAFLNAYLSAWKKYADAKDGEVKPQFLVIEEINRGNCAQIFGDIFQLLDRADNGFSTYPIVADSDISKSIEEAFKNEEVFKIDSLSIDGAVKNYNSDLSDDVREGRILLLPPNLYIWATMNTSDQSLFPIDSAFKRRWDWKYIKITNAYEKDDNGQYKTDEHGNKVPLNWKIKINETTEKDWWEFLDKINAIISNMTSSADKQLGYFFCKADENKVISVEKFVNKVIFYLWNDVFKDYGFEDSSLFLVKVKDKYGKDIDKDLTYPDFFDEDGKVNEEITIQFVDNVIKWSKKNENNL